MSEITFTEKEVEAHTKLLNMVYKKARFDGLNLEEIKQIQSIVVENFHLNKAMRDRIMELKEIIPAPDKESDE